jgi:hypothetical protein
MFLFIFLLPFHSLKKQAVDKLQTACLLLYIFDTFYPGGKTYLLKEFFIQAICIKQKDKNHATIDSELYREVRCLGHGFNTWVSVVK